MKDFEITYHLPTKVYTNADFFKEFPDEKPKKYNLLGIDQRNHVAQHETASDLAYVAAEELLSEHEPRRSMIGHLLFCGQELDYYTPTTAGVLQDRLRLPSSISALDFTHGCSGYGYGLFMAKSMLKASRAKAVLLLTGYTLTKVLHPKDRNARFIFGDAGTASFISNKFADRIGEFVFRTLGDQYDSIIVQDGFARNSLGPESMVEQEDQFGNISSRACFRMNGLRVFSFAMRILPTVVEELLEINHVKFGAVDYFVFHQANAFMLRQLAKKIGIPQEKMIIDMSKTGNTGQSSIPIVLKHMLQNGGLTGKKVMVVGFGTGLSVAATIVNF